MANVHPNVDETNNKLTTLRHAQYEEITKKYGFETANRSYYGSVTFFDTDVVGMGTTIWPATMRQRITLSSYIDQEGQLHHNWENTP